MRGGICFFLLGIAVLQAVSAQASTFVTSQSLSFGTLIPLVSAGSVSVALNGAFTTNGVVSIAPSGTAAYQGIGLFTGTGLGIVADLVSISVLTSSVTLTNSIGGGGTIIVNNFVTDPSISLTLLSPQSNVRVGGTASFTSASKRGSYTGVVQVRASGLLSGTVTLNLPIILTLWSTMGMTQTAPLNFGAIEMRGGNSVVRIQPPTGARTIASGAAGINLIASPTPTAGQFKITGEPFMPVFVVIPSSMTLTGSKGGTMVVNNFTGTADPTNVTLNAAGEMNLFVGADLNVGANQTSGTYTGTYSVIANY